MPWVSVSIEVAALAAEQLSEALLERGALSVDVADAQAGTHQETPLFAEPGEPAAPLWPVNTVSALFATEVDYSTLVREALAAAGLNDSEPLRIGQVAEQDWLQLTQQQFGPIEISPHLWIVPSWCQAPAEQALNLRLDPGLAFGTGSHPTTWQCLRWLEEHLAGGESLLDYGCGSGILTIAARKLGAGSVTGVDIDPNALDASRRNGTANDIAAQFMAPDGLPMSSFDIVVANILATPLRLLAPLLAQRTRLGGSIVLAGILDAQAEAVQAAYLPWFDLATVYPRDGWTCLAGTRKR